MNWTRLGLTAGITGLSGISAAATSWAASGHVSTALVLVLAVIAVAVWRWLGP